MELFPRLRSFLTTLILRERFEDSLDDEMRFHLNAHTDELIRTGVPAAEAARLARLHFGSIDAMKEECRLVRGLRLSNNLASAVGTLRRRIYWKTWHCVPRLLRRAGQRDPARTAETCAESPSAGCRSRVGPDPPPSGLLGLTTPVAPSGAGQALGGADARSAGGAQRREDWPANTKKR